MKLRLITPAADRRLLDDGRRTRAMTWIMAIMLFLTVLAAALGLATLAGATLLDRQITGRLTVQIVEASDAARSRDTQAALDALRHHPRVSRATEVDRAALAQMLRPWLGEDGADPDLPVPAMIDVDLTSGDDGAVAAVTQAVQAAVPTARIDRHERWMAPISNFMRIVIALAAGLVLLMATATATVVVLAARAGLDTHRDTIEILHMLGSTDMQIARLFQRRIALDTLIGGALGTLAAMAVIAFVGSRLAALGSDLLGSITLGHADWGLLVATPIAFALLATVAARYAVLAALRRYL
ncbi:MAG: cell division protein FtsX [Sphingomonas sp.]